MLVTISALVRCGKPSILRFCMAMTYGEAAAVPEPFEVPPRMATRVLSLYAQTMPTAKEPPIKKRPNLA